MSVYYLKPCSILTSLNSATWNSVNMEKTEEPERLAFLLLLDEGLLAGAAGAGAGSGVGSGAGASAGASAFSSFTFFFFFFSLSAYLKGNKIILK